MRSSSAMALTACRSPRWSTKPSRWRRSSWQRYVFADRQPQHQAAFVAILGEEPQPMPQGMARAVYVDRLAFDEDLPAVDPAGPQDGFGQFGTARAYPAGDAHDFAPGGAPSDV